MSNTVSITMLHYRYYYCKTAARKKSVLQPNDFKAYPDNDRIIVHKFRCLIKQAKSKIADIESAERVISLASGGVFLGSIISWYLILASACTITYNLTQLWQKANELHETLTILIEFTHFRRQATTIQLDVELLEVLRSFVVTENLPDNYLRKIKNSDDIAYPISEKSPAQVRAETSHLFSTLINPLRRNTKGSDYKSAKSARDIKIDDNLRVKPLNDRSQHELIHYYICGVNQQPVDRISTLLSSFTNVLTLLIKNVQIMTEKTENKPSHRLRKT